jgi:hypothetical protein
MRVIASLLEKSIQLLVSWEAATGRIRIIQKERFGFMRGAMLPDPKIGTKGSIPSGFIARCSRFSIGERTPADGWDVPIWGEGV